MLFLILSCLLHGLTTAQDFPDGKELLAVTVMYRHGDRTPIFTYPNDPYKVRYYIILDLY